MKRLWLLGLLATCLTDPLHNEYTVFQVVGPVLYDGRCVSFYAERIDGHVQVCDDSCTIEEGTLAPAGLNYYGNLQSLPGMHG